jgi:hypothetical protein
MDPVGPSDPSSGGTADRSGADVEAARRAAEILVELPHIDLNVLVLPKPDALLVDAMDRARRAAIGAGRGTMLESATRAARGVAMRAFSRSGFSGTWAVTDWAVSVVRPGDRVAAVNAFEAAVIAAVAEDLVDDDTVALLREPTDLLRRATGLSQPGELSNFSTPRAAPTGAVQVGLSVAVVIAGIVATFASGGIAAGLVVIAIGFAAVGAVGRRRSAP